ncbi:MAG: hypothetical protein AAGU74_03095 [Bacillota bacterium]
MNEAKECTHCGQCDVCDLDPNKICDNCCKCIESQQDDKNYAVLPVQLHRTEDAESMMPEDVDAWEEENALPYDDDDSQAYERSDDDDSEEDDCIAEPLNIDPLLIEEWEEKLRESFARTAGEPGKRTMPLHGQRIKKHRD